jgi:hypothetical protein
MGRFAGPAQSRSEATALLIVDRREKATEPQDIGVGDIQALFAQPPRALRLPKSFEDGLAFVSVGGSQGSQVETSWLPWGALFVRVNGRQIERAAAWVHASPYTAAQLQYVASFGRVVDPSEYFIVPRLFHLRAHISSGFLASHTAQEKIQRTSFLERDFEYRRRRLPPTPGPDYSLSTSLAVSRAALALAGFQGAIFDLTDWLRPPSLSRDPRILLSTVEDELFSKALARRPNCDPIEQLLLTRGSAVLSAIYMKSLESATSRVASNDSHREPFQALLDRYSGIVGADKNAVEARMRSILDEHCNR